MFLRLCVVKGGLARLVAGAVESNDETIADQLVAANTRNTRDVLDTLGPNRSADACKRRRHGDGAHKSTGAELIQYGYHAELKKRDSHPARLTLIATIPRPP